MVEKVEASITKATGNRHYLYLRSDLIQDSRFPFESDQDVTVRIDGERLVVEEVDNDD